MHHNTKNEVYVNSFDRILIVFYACTSLFEIAH